MNCTRISKNSRVDLLKPAGIMVASLGIEPRTRGFSMAFWQKSTLQPYANYNKINWLTAHARSQAQSTPDKSVRKSDRLLLKLF